MHLHLMHAISWTRRQCSSRRCRKVAAMICRQLRNCRSPPRHEAEDLANQYTSSHTTWGALGVETGRNTALLSWSRLQMPMQHRLLRRRTSVGRDKLLLELSSDEACLPADTVADVARKPGSEDHDRPLTTDDPVFPVPDKMSFASAACSRSEYMEVVPPDRPIVGRRSSLSLPNCLRTSLELPPQP